MKAYYSYNIVVVILVIAALSVIYLLRGPPLGLVVFDAGISNNTEFTSRPFDLYCAGSATTSLSNISIIVTDSGMNTTNTTLVTGLSNSTNITYNLANGSYVYYCEICGDGSCNVSSPISFLVNVPAPAPSSETYNDPVINLTFDNAGDPYKDYSSLDHSFSDNGAVTHSSSEFCKWYGCLNLSATSGDYLSSNALFDLNDGFTVSFWVYLNTEPSGSSSQSYFEFGDRDEGTYQYIEEGDYGFNIQYDAQNNNISESLGTGSRTAASIWNHYVIVYNNSHLRSWKNGALIDNQSLGNDMLVFNVGEPINVGRGIFGIDVEGYMDEFLVWNRGNFSQSEVEAWYDNQREGTPSDLDLAVKGITYQLPYDFTTAGNPLTDDSDLDIIITVSNLGSMTGATNVDVELTVEGNSICTRTVNLPINTDVNVTCQFDAQLGNWYDGSVVVDSSNDYDEAAYMGGTEDNNEYIFYLPYESHPRLRFNQTQWDNIIDPYASTSGNDIAYDSYNWYNSFLSEDFNPSWTADSVDPRGKKGFENALNCYINDFAAGTACTRARNHLDGWLTQVDDWDTSDVQAVHEIFHVGAIYDLMFPDFSEAEAQTYAQGLAAACLDIYGKSNVVPHTDSADPRPGNGFGFGSGMAGACFSVLGDYQENPTLSWDDPQSTVPRNTVFYWNERFERFLEGLKNDTNAIYPEGMLYHWYARYHIADVLWFLKRTEVTTTVTDHQPVICSFAKEAAYNILDYNYDGATLRGDENNMWRQVSYGDTNSYEQIGSDGLNKWDVITVYGLLCDDPPIKNLARTLRLLGHSTGEQTRSVGGLYYYSLLANEASILSDIGDVLPPFTFSSAFDRITLRRGFTYQNDTVIIFDGGDEASGGHPNAEFALFSYAYGEPFLDFNQVPYNDDVRSEVWANTISFSQSTVSGYNTDPTDVILHQYYGGQDITGTYPDFYFRPDGYRGDVEHAIGTSDGQYASFHAYHPYHTTVSDPIRDVVIFDDLLLHVDKVHRTTGGSIYANWLNIYDEFTPTMTDANLTFQRAGTNKYYSIAGLWSSAGSISLSGGDSGTAYCFQKTSCSGGLGNYGKYYHEVTGPDAVTIFAHHWYRDSPSETILLYDGTDKGVQTVDKTIIFDTNEDGAINESIYDVDAHSLSFKTNIVAVTGSTNLKKNDISFFRSIPATSSYIDTTTPGIINATVSADSFTSIAFSLPGATSAIVKINNETIHSSQYTIVNDEITLNIQEGVHEIYIDQVGDAPPVYSIGGPAANAQFITNTNQDVSFSCLGTDDQFIDSIFIQTNRTGNMTTEQSISPLSAGGVLAFIANFPQGNYAWTCSVRDNASQTTTSPLQHFVVTPVPVVYPDADKFTGRTTDFLNLPSLENQTGIILENISEGFLNFTGVISSLDGVNLSQAILIENDFIEVRTDLYPQLNVPACLEFFNLSYSNPRILKDGDVYTDHSNFFYVNNTLEFCVSGFSKYQVEETPPSTPADDDDDEGSSGGSGGGGGGGAGGGAATITSDDDDENASRVTDDDSPAQVQVFEDSEVAQDEESDEEEPTDLAGQATITVSSESEPTPEQPVLISPEFYEEYKDQLIIGSGGLFLVIILGTVFFIKRQQKIHR